MTGNRRASDRGSLVITRGLIATRFFGNSSSSDLVGVNGKLASCETGLEDSTVGDDNGETRGDRGTTDVETGGNGNLKE